MEQQTIKLFHIKKALHRIYGYRLAAELKMLARAKNMPGRLWFEFEANRDMIIVY